MQNIENGKSIKANSAALLGFLLVFLLKGKTLFLALIKIKGVATVLTMLINIAAYWWTGKLGLPAAAGFVILLLVHELGHVFALRYYGIAATSPLFIPFVGAVVGLKQLPGNAYQEAVVALAGPVLGSIGAAVCLVVYLATANSLWLWLFAVGVLLNLFNLIPASPLDGGRIVGAVWRGFWAFGIAGLIWLAWEMKDQFMLMIAFVCLTELTSKVITSRVQAEILWSAFSVAVLAAIIVWHWWFSIFVFGCSLLVLAMIHYSPDSINRSEPENYCNLSIRERLTIGSVYIALAAVLCWAMYWLNQINAFKAAH